MDEETRTYLAAIEERLTTRMNDGLSTMEERLMTRMNDGLSTMEARLMTRMNDGLSTMEARLMTRMNDGFEHVANRVDAVERDLRHLRTEHATTRELVSQLPVTLLAAIERPILNHLAETEARVTGLERKQPKA